MNQNPLRFAPLIRVSTERQEKQGESLGLQRKQLAQAIENLGGVIHDWYGGQEHATPQQERKELDRLLADACAGKFDAVVVADLSRWSRDNRRSRNDLEILKQHGIRFFVGQTEFDLFSPTQSLFVGMSAEFNEFFAQEQCRKSILNRIERAERAGYPSSGPQPYGRKFNKKTEQWEVVPEKKELVERIAQAYLDGMSFKDLGDRFGLPISSIYTTLTKRSGGTWEQHFSSKRCNISKVVPTTIPPLLPDETIQKILDKAKQRRTWDHKTTRFTYLLNRILVDARTGTSLTAATKNGVRYYYPFQARGNELYLIRADDLETSVLDVLYEVLGCSQSLQQAVFNESSKEEVRNELLEKRKSLTRETANLEKRIKKLINLILEDDREDGQVHQLMQQERRQLDDRYESIEAELRKVENSLKAIPSEAEIEAKRVAFLEEMAYRLSYFNAGHSLRELSPDNQKKILNIIFGGTDPQGKRYGIYITVVGDKKPRTFRFEAYGRLGSITGWVEREKEELSYIYPERYRANDPEMARDIAEILGQHQPGEACKARSESISF